MMLSDLRRHIEERGQATLADLSAHFGADPVIVRHMLEIWIRKGRLRRQCVTDACRSCTLCDAAASEIYVPESRPRPRPASCRMRAPP